jgi:hypothetical protein
MEDISVRYEFSLPDGGQEVFDLNIKGNTLILEQNEEGEHPDWAKLDYHQCPNCPLSTDEYPYCPPSLDLADVVRRFDGLLSYDKVSIKVTTAERTITQNTSAQKGISAMMGLIMATSGCPHAAYFKPMARFHLPLSSEEETIYRVTSMYLLAQYFIKKENKGADLELDGLTKIYENMQVVNISIAERLRSATRTDSSVNAIVLLDIYAKSVPIVIEESLEEIRYLFSAYFDENPSTET